MTEVRFFLFRRYRKAWRYLALTIIVSFVIMAAISRSTAHYSGYRIPPLDLERLDLERDTIREAGAVAGILIGTQVWMQVNLDTDRFNNGDLIPEARSNEEWIRLGNEGKPAWCYYDNDSSNRAVYGKLYNWYAISDPRGLAPKGWHIPSDNDWNVLENYLGHDAMAGGELKSKEHWKAPNEKATNSTRFYGVPGGLRNFVGDFSFLGENGYWWTSSALNSNFPEYRTLFAWYRSLFHGNGYIVRRNFQGQNGLSVRCVRY